MLIAQLLLFVSAWLIDANRSVSPEEVGDDIQEYCTQYLIGSDPYGDPTSGSTCTIVEGEDPID